MTEIATVLGLSVYRGPGDTNYVALSELLDWMNSRDAACAEYLVDAINEFNDTGESVED